jgi:3-hydroxyisobutyrate dehydrogenase-like beta-hydroxyacid dehydrogenase
MRRSAFLGFPDGNALGSAYTRVKAKQWVSHDFAATFTPDLMRTAIDMGIALAHQLGASMPLATATSEFLQSLIDSGENQLDFSTLLLRQAGASSRTLKPG